MSYPLSLLRLLQLVSPALPVGAYSYSEGLEILVQDQVIRDKVTLEYWLEQELRQGAIRLEAAVMLRVYQASLQSDFPTIARWNHWLSAARETEELRQQSWQMGRALTRLLQETQLTEVALSLPPLLEACGTPCNFAVAFGIAAAAWQIEPETALLGYLFSWAANLVSAGVRLIPLGQTAGQQLLLDLHEQLLQVATQILSLDDSQLESCTWGLSLSSMLHETQYSRLFRS